jgi:hypothetical protein
MDLATWNARVATLTQCDRNLHHFNGVREQSNPHLAGIRHEFDDHLKRLPISDQRKSPAKQLQAFFKTKPTSIGMKGASVRSNRCFSRMTSLTKKDYGNRAIEMEALSLDHTSIDAVTGSLPSAIRTTAKQSGAGRIALQRYLTSQLQAHISKKILPAAVVGAVTLGATTGPPGTPTSDALAWVTCQKALTNEMGEQPESIGPAYASLYAAAYHGSMGLPMSNFIGKLVGPDRALLLYDIEFPDIALNMVRQPNMFSGGNAKLFVTRDPSLSGSDDMPGRTVRLIDTECCDDDNAAMKCPAGKCGAVGLPEAVVPFSEIGRATISLRGVFVLYPKEARRYAVPNCELVRAKN